MWWICVACGPNADDDTGPPAPTCGEEETTPLTEVDAPAWPDGLADGLITLGEINGVWQATLCDDPLESIEVKLIVPPQETVAVYTGDLPTPECGCSLDPHFQPDGAYLPVGISDMEVYIGAYPDNALAQRTVVTKAVLFSAGQDLELRACGGNTVDPVLGSDWTEASVIVRVDGAGALTGTILLQQDGSTHTEICELTEWIFVTP